MALTVAVQMDPIQSIRIAGDTTFGLMLEAQARGHSLYTYTPDRLSMQGRLVTAYAQPVTVQDVEGEGKDLRAIFLGEVGDRADQACARLAQFGPPLG